MNIVEKTVCIWSKLFSFDHIQDNEDCIPLHCAFYAAIHNNALINFLLTHISQDTNHADSRGLTYFHIACTRNAVERVETLLENGVSVNLLVALDGKSYSGYFALHFAIDFNKKDVVQLLLRYGADVNANVGNLMTPLHLACLHSRTKI